MTLEKLRKRITSTSLSYGNLESHTFRFFHDEILFFPASQNHREAPVFKVFAELAIPNVAIQPPTDEVQTYLQ